MTEKIGQAGANAVPFWVRIMLAQGQAGPRGEKTMAGGTLGLRLFGLRELEYAPAPLEPGFIMQHAFTTSEYLLRSGKSLSVGETVGVNGQQIGFAISHADKGNFSSSPVALFSLITQPKAS
jgi:hypothetical protein